MRVFGEIEGIAVGTEFASRAELAASGIHKPIQTGISGSESNGADSIVISGGYADDEDYGDYIVYMGQGGNDPVTKLQIADQELTRGNLALVVSYIRGLPVRVTRGLRSRHRTYRYDGLYLVERWWAEISRSGHKIFRYALRQINEKAVSTPSGELPLPTGSQEPDRVKSYTTRVVRDTAVAEMVKKIHTYQCQVCTELIQRPGGAYAEGAHIRPLGRPHNGPDTADNILCLCPNCHVLFSGWAFSIEDDGSFIGGMSGTLVEHEEHAVSRDHIAYHRRCYQRVIT